MYKKNKLFLHFAFTVLCVLIAAKGYAQSVIIEIANCGGEHRSRNYDSQLSNIMWCLVGKGKFSENKLLKFSSKNSIQINDLEQKSSMFIKSLPKYYFDEDVKVVRLDTKPNEDDRIWFDYIFVEQDRKGNIIIYSGFKTFFDGTDPVEERKHPEISEIITLLDKKQIRPYNDIIKKLLVANGITLPPPQKRNPNKGKDEKPPEVEKLEN
jgi:hypothetical protein